MALEVVDIVENSAAAGQEEESDTMEPPVKEEAAAAPTRRGRPPGSPGVLRVLFSRAGSYFCLNLK